MPATAPSSGAAGAAASAETGAATGAAAAAGAADARPRRRLRAFLARHDRIVTFAAGVAAATLVVLAVAWLRNAPQQLTQEDFDEAVKESLKTLTLPSQAARAYEVIQPSVVRVRGLSTEQDSGNAQSGNEDEDDDESVGSGVVIVDKGIILTNLHVVAGAKRVRVVFFDGFEADAEVIGMQPENDLAVLKAKAVPDDLVAATLRSTSDLVPGDQVIAVGFPFGIGPSTSAGVVSGLNREYQSPEGKRLLTNLIQFDAAANPGNSGGPLVTAEGEVVGIVTGILNPSSQRTFIGIGFAVPIENAASAFGIPPF
jgi:S1-C subfamily serine protease